MADTTVPTLRLTQTSSQANRHTIELEWLDAGPRQTATATVELALTEQDQRDLAWYVEEYAEYPFEPHPQRAARIEARMRELGIELFNTLFASNTRTLRLWAKVAEHLDDLRVEIVTDAEGATALPWELLRDPDTDTVLALHAKAFVRAAPEAPRQALVLADQPVIRILLVICRPAGGDDVPFRSVATRIIKGLSAETREVFQLDVLRPPTFAQLATVLSDAKANGKPYHVVHFDGHGVYGLPDTLPAAPLLELPSEQLDTGQRSTLRSLAVVLHELGAIQYEQGTATCVENSQDGYDLALSIGDHAVAAICGFNLGHAYLKLPSLRDLAQAERWCRRSLELTPGADRLTWGKGLGELGLIAYERFKEAKQAKQSDAKLLA